MDLVPGALGVAITSTPPFVQFDDGTWAAEIHVDDPAFEQSSPMTAIGPVVPDGKPGSVTWRGATDTPFDPQSAPLVLTITRPALSAARPSAEEAPGIPSRAPLYSRASERRS